jgi:probable F420-dependent oxidoreductase
MAGTELHFGATLGLGVETTAPEAQLLEELGYEYVGSGEHFMRGNPPWPSSATLPVLAVAAGATSTIRLVSSVLLVPFYHPTVLAKLTNTLDIASNGRLTLGIGVGGEFPVEFEAAGIPPRQRGGRTNECLEALRLLWTQENVHYQGRYYQLEDVTIVPPPAQEPHPPIWVAGRRDPAMKRAVRYGEGWYPYLYSPERYRDSVEKIKAFADEEGRDLSDFQWVNFQFISINDSKEEAAEVAARSLGGNYLYSGNFMDIVGQYCILGTAEDCIRRIQDYVDAGARHFVFSWACPADDRPRHIETVANEIIPYFRG